MAITASEREYLLEGMENLLKEYDYKYTRDALNEIIDEWDRQKAGFIDAFKKYPNYIEGKFMIAFDADYERGIDKRASNQFANWIIDVAIPETKDMPHPTAITKKCRWHYWMPYDEYNFFVYLRNYATRCISESTAQDLNGIFVDLRFHAGQKTSRVVNKICQYLGFDKVDGYNREFAKYADSLSPLTIKRHTILSINPLDYLTMSFGNSWASCHTIDKENKRNMPNNYSGCYSSGTVSYMLDESSMVLYTVDASYNGTEYWTQPKINRQMFHYGKEKLVQGRLYPQDNDSFGDMYTPYRNIVQNIISTIFDFPNLWTLSKGTDNASRYIFSYGTHYRDYNYYENCSLSRIKGSENENSFVVGASPICIKCGERHREADNISCCTKVRCADCGHIVTQEDVIWIDGEPYCRDCVHYCEHCHEYTRDDVSYVRGYGYVCSSCLDRNFTYCECCDTYVWDEDTTYIDCEDRHVCKRCLHRYYSYCEDCGEYFPDDETQLYRGRVLCESCYDARVEEEESETDEDEVC